MATEQTDNTRPSTLDKIKDQYGIRQKFAEMYLRQWFAGGNIDEATLSATLQSPLHCTWFDFALSTNKRGEQIGYILKPFIPESARQYLDVGCAYGGFLVAFANMGFTVTGVELDDRLIEFTKTNLSDYQIRGKVIKGDILDPGLVSGLGKFDVITCNDVIEHVMNVPKTIEHMVYLLNPGGVLVMQMPNKDSLRSVANDGHYNLFGITLLERTDAIRFFEAHRLDYAYDVGEYHELEYYKELLTQAGCNVQVLPPITIERFRAVGTLLLKTLKSYLDYRRAKRRNIPSDLDKKLERKFLLYLWDLMKSAVATILYYRNKIQYFESFKQKYLTDAWLILAKKR